MVRTRKIIGKDDLFKYVLDEKIAKVELTRSHNKTIKNSKVCSVYIFWNTEHRGEIHTILGQCKAATLETLPNKKALQYVLGVGSNKNEYLSAGTIEKLIEIQKEFNYSFSISNSIRKLIKK